MWIAPLFQSTVILPPSVEAGLSDTLDCGTTSLGLFGAAFGQGNLNYQWTSTGGKIYLAEVPPLTR
ncbi:MAG: hypothetical protein R2792_11635 [Saprospiraceae bacterium]